MELKETWEKLTPMGRVGFERPLGVLVLIFVLFQLAEPEDLIVSIYEGVAASVSSSYTIHYL